MELKLHTEGQKDHLKTLKEWFNKQVKLLKTILKTG